MRLHEIMGIEANRRWGVCSLNEFRKVCNFIFVYNLRSVSNLTRSSLASSVSTQCLPRQPTSNPDFFFQLMLPFWNGTRIRTLQKQQSASTPISKTSNCTLAFRQRKRRNLLRVLVFALVRLSVLLYVTGSSCPYRIYHKSRHFERRHRSDTWRPFLHVGLYTI